MINCKHEWVEDWIRGADEYYCVKCGMRRIIVSLKYKKGGNDDNE